MITSSSNGAALIIPRSSWGSRALEVPRAFRRLSDDWDETIPAIRIRARLSTAPQAGPAAAPLAKGSGRSNAAASGSAAAAPPSVYHIGDRVRVEWHGSTYPATILNTLGDDRYRIHYEGYGPEWDEDIAMGRIQRKRTKRSERAADPQGETTRGAALQPGQPTSFRAPSADARRTRELVVDRDVLPTQGERVDERNHGRRRTEPTEEADEPTIVGGASP